MSSIDSYRELIDRLKELMRQESQADMAQRLDIFPVGVEVILNNPDWGIYETCRVARALGVRISFGIY